jgi:outer membrane protein TolC
MQVSPASRRKRRAAFRALAACVACLAISVAAATEPSLDFTTALAHAESSAPSLRARSAEVTAAREEAVRAGALPDPQLIVGIDNLPITGPHALDPSADFMTMKKIGLMQEFPAGAKREARHRVAERLLEQAQALSAVEQLQVREAVADAWLSTWTAQRELAMLDELRKQAALAVLLAEARLRGGTGSAVDAMAAKAAALDVDNRIDTTQAMLAAARAGLGRWLGVDPADLPSLGTAPDLSRLPVTEPVLLATVARQRPLADWRSREAVAEARLQEAIADKRPDWSVMAAYGQRDQGRDDMLMLEFRIGLPLFARNRQARGVAARRAEVEAAAAEREDAERAQTEALRTALAQWHGLREQVERHETQILPLAEDRTDAALAAYRAGGALQPWLDARRDQLEAHLMHVRHLGELARIWSALAFLLPGETAR